MKFFLPLLLTTVVSLSNLPAEELPASFLHSFLLNERAAYPIPVAVDHGMTTLIFPEPPLNFAASHVAFIEPGQTAPDYSKDDRIEFVVLAHRGGTTCSIRALRPDAQDTLSVFLGGKVYQLFLHGDETQPLLTVEFKFPDPTRTGQSVSITPSRLIDCLTRAKAYPVLLKYYPDELDGVTHVISNHVTDYPDFRVQISEVFRFDDADTLVFHLLLQNRSDRDIVYRRRRIAVRLGPPATTGQPLLYDASIVDATGLMPAQSVTSAWVAITGKRNGGRNELDPARNVFTVLIPRASFPEPVSPRADAPTLDPKVISF